MPRRSGNKSFGLRGVKRLHYRYKPRWEGGIGGDESAAKAARVVAWLRKYEAQTEP